MRMLGEGRPFVIELQHATRGHPSHTELREIEDRLKRSEWYVIHLRIKPCQAVVVHDEH